MASVLVVDDDDDLLDAVSLFCSMKGHQVTRAADGKEALARVAEHMPEVILLDMKMPVMDGWAFARAFRERYDHAAPIVVLTAAHDAEARAKEIDAEGWLPKPFESADLFDAIDRAAHDDGSEK